MHRIQAIISSIFKESEIKDALKPICNDDCVILGRSEAKNQNNTIVVTVRL